MKVILLLALTSAAVSAIPRSNGNHQAPLDGGSIADAERYLLELSPGETIWATEDEKWALRRV
jgi:leucyl aminopeptidase